jgi:uncharacterized protein (DUF849 family)
VPEWRTPSWRSPRRAVHPGELAASAAGAEAIHLHPRDGEGGESLLAADVGAAVAAVRRACPGTPVGVSTGVWITHGDPAARRAAVARWAGLPCFERPEFASVNLSEPGPAELAELLALAGIEAEAGVWSLADADMLAAAGPARRWLRVLVEVPATPVAAAVAAADQILRRLDELAVTAPRLVHGEQQACWPLVADAGTLGLPTRIGLEDTTTGPDGGPISGNAQLTRLALDIWAASAAR